MAGSLKIRLVYICFPTFFQLPDKCHNICVAFLENILIEFTTYAIKIVIITQKRVEMDEYYGKL